jgi:hypothetical protein
MAFVKNAFNVQRILNFGFPDLTDQSVAAYGFGPAGYSDVTTTPRQEFGITFTYAFGSR